MKPNRLAHTALAPLTSLLLLPACGTQDDTTDPETQGAVAEMRAVTDQPAAAEQSRRLPADLRAYPSTWTDLHERRGETEAGFLNGEIILLGEKYGLPTPFNSTLLEVVEGMARDRIPPGRHTLTELRELVESHRGPVSPVSPHLS